jgi:ABC-type nitrate/sulfonate/bicarbonate transport system substrate-binding protein
MKIKSYTVFLITAALITLIFLSGVSGAEETMKITYSRGIDDLPLYVALEEGLWKKEGINVELVRLVGEQNIVAAALHGDIDAGHIELGGAFHAGLQNIPVKVVAWLGHAHKGTRCGLHVDKNSNIFSISDLKGKRIAEAGSITTAMILSETLKAAGLTKDDINSIKGIKLDDSMKHEAALRSKGIDVIVA